MSYIGLTKLCLILTCIAMCQVMYPLKEIKVSC